VPARKLKLHNNKIGDGSVPHLVELIKKQAEDENEPLRELHLSHNKLSLDGVQALVDAALDTGAYPGKSTVPFWLRVEKNTFKSFPEREGVCVLMVSQGRRRPCSPFSCVNNQKVHIVCDE